MAQHSETMSTILLHKHGSSRGFVTETESLTLANQEKDPVIIAILLFLLLIIVMSCLTDHLNHQILFHKLDRLAVDLICFWKFLFLYFSEI